jgi:uncharacterized circularly permuted ATP-grasp superfamily protein/uncharacterized alpha-E superfamily protein
MVARQRRGGRGKHVSIKAEPAAPLAAMFGGYAPLRGAYDEVLDDTGAPRPHWRSFIAGLARLGNNEAERRFEAAARHMHEADVFHRVQEDGAAAVRAWPLSATPLIIPDQDWQAIAAGVAQRASLIEAVLADAYGPQNMIADGRLPAAAIAGSPEFLRPLAGVVPRGGRFLRLYAADLGRGPDGRWWVVADRTQAPSGAGYALENRLAVSRALPDLFRDHDPQRLAGFFSGFREALQALAREGAARVSVLSPGAFSETYFEHAYLARYLGFHLIEGEDLIVRGDELYLRTVEGLERADVLLRRLDADFADPLELNAASRIGAPGLLRVIRAGHVAIANALGAGLAESRALMSFMPALAESVLGEPLKLPNIATWWCGQARERDLVIERFDSMAVAPAFRQTGPAPFARGAAPVAELDRNARARLIDALTDRGMDYVGQEMVRLSTMPVWRGDRFEPHPFALRVFAAASEDGGWIVMPGGFCRISHDFDPRAASLQHGGYSADAWVLSGAPAEQVSLLRARGETPVRREAKALTSRAADNLFWLGRYMERAEATLRLIRAAAARAAEGAGAGPLVGEMCDLLVAWGAAPDDDKSEISAILFAALARADLPGSAPALAEAARYAGTALRDRISPDAWRAILDLREALAAPVAGAPFDAFERADAALRYVAAFSGAAQENMTRAQAWRFLEIGRRIERAIAESRFLRALARPGASAGAIDVLLELGDSQIAYAQRYFLATSRTAAIDLLALDPANPRSCVFQVDRLREHVDRLPGAKPGESTTNPQRLMERLTTELHLAEASHVDEEFLLLQEEALMALSDALSDRYMLHRDESDLS